MTASTPDLSVVIPAHRAIGTIARTLESVFAQELVRPEVIVVIDGADLETERLVAGYPVQVVVNPVPRGSQQARNRGLAAVSTEYVAFLDSDDYIIGELHHGMLESLRQAGADIVFAPWNHDIGNATGHLHRDDLESLASRDSLLVAWAGGRVSQTGAMAWRTESLRAIGGWDAALTRFQDAEIGFRSIACGLTHCFSREGQLVYVLHDSDTRVTARPWDRDRWALDRFFSYMEEVSRHRPHGAAMRAALSNWAYHLAVQAFRSKNREAGRLLLRIAKRNGALRLSGSLPTRLATRIIGLERKIDFAERIAWLRRGRSRV